MRKCHFFAHRNDQSAGVRESINARAINSIQCDQYNVNIFLFLDYKLNESKNAKDFEGQSI